MSDFMLVVSKTPSLISTTLKHCFNGPPKPSWDLKFHLSLKLTNLMVGDFGSVTVEQVQGMSGRPTPVPAGVIINESKVDNKYRYDAQVHIEKILKPYEHVLGSEWKNLKDDGIPAEWIQAPNDGWEKRETRKTILYLHGGAYYMCSKSGHPRNILKGIIKEADLRVFSIDYRLAPQDQFPAGLHDALAAYLYLLNPPKDAGFEPINPKNIIISGDSAGGGLSMALALAIRDAGLPPCAGVIGLSPWVDLTSSMPSMSADECLDYIQKPGTAFRHKPSTASIESQEWSTANTARIKKQNLGPKIWHDSFDVPERLQMYAPNEALAIPYVSPMLAESLGDLPPLLLMAGGEERLRDEIVYFAYRCTEPSKYKGPSYNADKFENSPFKTPTNITLEVYEELPHVFQLFEHNSTKLSYERAALFINKVFNTSNEPLPPSSYYCISGKGEIGPLIEKYKEALKWEKVGIAPDIQM